MTTAQGRTAQGKTAQGKTAQGKPAQLPPLRYGVATSAYQIEGAFDEDGRGPSIWDTFAATPGKVVDGTDGKVACDSYHRGDDDLDLITGLGAHAYRFSISWPRIVPTGSGPVESRGLDHYERLVDALLARGVAPLATLYHWDLPQPLEDAGGWPVRATAERFADYAGAVADRLGDRVAHWATLNEPWCSAFLGYASGVHAPGRQDPEASMAAAHHLLLAHALGAEAVRAAVPGADVGIVLNMAPVRPEPGCDPAAVDVVEALQNRLWVDALVDGRYPQVLVDRSAALREDGVALPGDLDRIAGSAAWIGVNYYTPFRPGRVGVADRAVGQDSLAYPYAPPFAFHPRPPHTTMGWESDATGLEDIVRWVAGRAPGVPLRITENGVAFPDALHDGHGAVQDDDRIDYLREHLAAVDRARAAGAPVLDYLAWSLLDNFEWAEGYRQNFGLVSVDAQTQRRTPKASYAWYAAHIAAAMAPAPAG